MKFKKIVLQNFRQFKGEHVIEFSDDDDKNITVIYGGITFGKTTLLQAFNWVLYDKLDLQKPDELLNLEVEAALKPLEEETVKVQVYLETNDSELERKQYRFTRIQNYKMGTDGRRNKLGGYSMVEVEKNDTWINQGSTSEIINKILPQNLSTYFFFDGERIETISKEQREGSEQVGKSVKSILGLEHYSTAIKHINGTSKFSVINELRSKYNASTDSEIDTNRNRIIELQGKLVTSQEKIKNYENEIEKLEIDKSAKEKIILENKATFEKQQNKENLKNKLLKLEERRSRLLLDYKSYFNTYYLDFFYCGLENKIENLQKSGILSEEEEAIPNMHAKSIEHILKRGYCLCGERIDNKEDSHYKAIIEEMKKLPPQSIGISIKEFNKETKQNIQNVKAENFKTQLQSKYKDIIDNEDEINTIQDQIDMLSDEIQTNVNVGSLERDVKEIEKKIREYYEKIGTNKTLINNYQNVIKNAEDAIKKIAQYDEKNREISKQIDYAEHIAKILELNYRIRERKLINDLQKEINEYLSQIYEGQREMKITEDYKFKLLYKDDLGSEEVSSESEGLGIVKAISFMCGLLEVAKTKMNNEEDIISENEYPLVFDAPLSKIDSIHRRNVMKCLPEVASQVIIFTREKKDLEDILEETRNKIGREYYINKITEKNSEIKKGEK